MKKKSKIKLNWGMITASILCVITLLFFGLLSFVDVVPGKYFYPCIIVFVLLIAVLSFFLSAKKIKKGIRISCYAISALLVILMAVASSYLVSTLGFFDNFGDNSKVEHYSLVVLKDSKYTKLSDLKDKEIGYFNDELSTIAEAIVKLNEKVKTKNTEYEDYDSLYTDLVDKKIAGVFIPESQINILKEENEELYNKMKIIETINIKSKMEVVNPDLDITKDPFTIYISGIDTYGKISSVSRSDVNMLVSVNPKTKQVLLISIPRDYYVQVNGTTGLKDKLTHVGIYGVEKSAATVGDLFDIKVDYYVKVNFTSVEKLIDKIDGVDVYSEYTFVSYIDKYKFYKGYNHMNGKQALAFSRERKSFSSGDRARGKNQQAVIEGIVKKLSSSTIITKYNSILNALDGSFQTNITDKEMKKLIKMQIENMAKWTVTSTSVDGTDSSNYTYTSPKSKAYVMVPIQSTIDEAIAKINQIKNGEVFNGNDKPVTDVKKPVQVNPYVPPVSTPKPTTPNPVTPTTPEVKPEVPVAPEKPTTPEIPGVPTVPETPDTKPETPDDKPETPTTPEKPDDSNDGDVNKPNNTI